MILIVKSEGYCNLCGSKNVKVQSIITQNKKTNVKKKFNLCNQCYCDYCSALSNHNRLPQGGLMFHLAMI